MIDQVTLGALARVSICLLILHLNCLRATAGTVAEAGVGVAAEATVAVPGGAVVPSVRADARSVDATMPFPATLSPLAERRALSLAVYAESMRALNVGREDLALPMMRRLAKIDPLFTEAHLKLASHYIGLRNYRDAEAWLRLGLHYRPESPRLRAALAKTLYDSRQRRTGLILAREVLADDPTQVAAHDVVFSDYASRNETAQVVEWVDRLMSDNRTDADFWLRMARLYERFLKTESYRSEEEIRKLLIPVYEKALDGERPSVVHRKLGELHLQMGNRDEALLHLRQAFELAPGTTGLGAWLARHYASQGEEAEAIAVYEKLTALPTASAEAYLELGELYERKGEANKALVALERAQELTPQEPAIPFKLGSLYEQTKDYSRAEAAYRQAILLRPDWFEANLSLALLQLAHRTPQVLQRTLDSARERFPDVAQFVFLAAINARQREDFDRAIELIDEAKTLSAPKTLISKRYYTEKAFILEKMGKRDDGEPYLQEGLENYPDDSTLQNSLAYLYAEQGRNLDEALELSQKSLKQAPDNDAYLDTLGWIYFKMGRYEEALTQLLKAVENGGDDDPIVLAHVAECLDKMGRHGEARSFWKSVLKHDPDNEQAKQALASDPENDTESVALSSGPSATP